MRNRRRCKYLQTDEQNPGQKGIGNEDEKRMGPLYLIQTEFNLSPPTNPTSAEQSELARIMHDLSQKANNERSSFPKKTAAVSELHGL